MTKGAVYWHFESKGDLLCALLSEAMARFSATLSEHMEGRELTFPAVAEMLLESAGRIISDKSRSEFFMLMQPGAIFINASRGEVMNEDALKAALTQAGRADSDPTYVIFFTDGEPSQYSNYHGANTFNGGDPSPSSYGFYFNSFLSRESCNDEARALVDSGYQLYGVFAFNDSGHTYPNGVQGDESDSDLLHNLLKYGYNTDQNLGVNEQTHAFMVNTGKFNIRITPKLMTESVDVTIITPENSVIARIELNKTGPIDEAYGKMEKSQRDEIKTYFNMLSDIDIDQPVESVAEPDIHFTED
jgi:hypothetical protein